MAIEDLIGLTLSSVKGAEIGSDKIIFTTIDGRTFSMYHCQDCCEQVSVEDIAGDIQDLIGTPILQAEEVSSEENPTGVVKEYQGESFTWTFYKLSTIKGSVTIRWYGTSNGYYSESVNFIELTN